ncbi:MAG: hypothetical protein HFH47_02070 [Bacilli bacterium]|nr:hypothetical protein [Bacilli bacterium]
MTDKALLKAAGIISIVIGIISCLTIVGLLWGIPMIIGGYKFNEYSVLDDNQVLNHKSSILGWSIFFIFFSFVSAILGFIYYFGLNNIETKEENMSYLDELERLKKLYDEKAITKTEYEKKKKEILGEK